MELNIEKLEAHRNVLNENPRKFSIRIGVSHAWYYKIISGNSVPINPRIDTINRIAEALKIQPMELIK